MPGWYFKDRISTLGDLVEALEAVNNARSNLDKAKRIFEGLRPETTKPVAYERNRLDVRTAQLELDALLAIPIIPEEDEEF